MMMTDKELLKHAALAAGIENLAFDSACIICSDESGYSAVWNPLEDDGDAFRLAVKLRMNVFHAGIRVHAMDEEGDIEAAEGHERDPFAATRRAIVLAAAAMVKDAP